MRGVVSTAMRKRHPYPQKNLEEVQTSRREGRKPRVDRNKTLKEREDQERCRRVQRVKPLSERGAPQWEQSFKVGPTPR